MCIRRGGAEHECAKVGVANITWPKQDGERERKGGLGFCAIWVCISSSSSS